MNITFSEANERILASVGEILYNRYSFIVRQGQGVVMAVSLFLES